MMIREDILAAAIEELENGMRDEGQGEFVLTPFQEQIMQRYITTLTSEENPEDVLNHAMVRHSMAKKSALINIRAEYERVLLAGYTDKDEDTFMAEASLEERDEYMQAIVYAHTIFDALDNLLIHHVETVILH